jgi:hypothetical protein
MAMAASSPDCCQVKYHYYNYKPISRENKIVLAMAMAASSPAVRSNTTTTIISPFGERLCQSWRPAALTAVRSNTTTTIISPHGEILC